MTEALHLAFSLGCVLAVWGGLFLLLTGLGLGLLAAAYGGSEARSPGLVPACWCGYAVAIAALQIWHLFLPVDGRALAALTVLSLAGWQSRRVLKAEPGTPLALPVLLTVCGLALWAADRSIGPFESFDGANYHLTVVRWFNRFAVVPGLANLNPLYGLNSSSLLFPALLEQGPGTARSYHFCNGFLLVLFLLLAAPRVARLFAGSSVAPSHSIAAAVFLFPAIILLIRESGGWLSSHVTDLPPIPVVFSACVLALQAFDQDRNETSSDLSPRLFIALALLAITPCLKATTLIFGATAWMVLFFWSSWRGRRTGPRSPSLRPAVCAILLAFAAVGTWIVRNVLLSGYPLYPATLGAFDVDWRLPLDHAMGYIWWTRAYTRAPMAWDLMTPGETGWLSYWLRMELRIAIYETLIPLALVGLWVLVWILARRPLSRRPILLIPPLVAIPAWFLLAPSVRYGAVFFWALCALVAAELLPPALATLSWRRQLLATGVVLSAAAPFVCQTYFMWRHPDASAPALGLLTSPGPDRGFHPLYRPPLTDLTVCGNLRVSMPAARFSEKDPAPPRETVPWDGPLPSTSLLLDGLCPRRAGTLESGFRIVTDGRPWPERNAGTVLAVQQRTGWSPGRLAIYFCVRPELITESLRWAKSGDRNALLTAAAEREVR
jgi:hypothetical protein